MTPWETELANYLTELSDVQKTTLAILQRKGEMLSRADHAGLRDIAEEEKQAMDRLQIFLDKREQLLKIAKAEGLPNDSIESLAKRVDIEASSGDMNRSNLSDKCQDSIHQSRILQHQSLTNWVLTQRTLIHLSQMLEIIATKGHPNTTYNSRKAKETARSGGALVDIGG
ncbi:MAG: flagellar export chaperone FlgN [Thermoguttaceae bacterium]